MFHWETGFKWESGGSPKKPSYTVGRDGTWQVIIDMLKCRFGSENQAEMYKAEMKARRRRPGESLQKQYSTRIFVDCEL